jgi:hypothetical protein
MPSRPVSYSRTVTMYGIDCDHMFASPLISAPSKPERMMRLVRNVYIWWITNRKCKSGVGFSSKASHRFLVEVLSQAKHSRHSCGSSA